MTPAVHAALADAVLVLHVGIVAFVVGGLLAVAAGGLRGWRWVRRPGFRYAHLGAIGFVVLQAWLGQTCPLTALESWLRVQAGQPPYGGGGFIAHALQAVLYHDAPPWVFTLAYSLFGALVVLAWWACPPQRRR